MTPNEKLLLGIATAGAPGLACAMMAAQRGDKLLTFHCGVDRSKVYVKADRIADVVPGPWDRGSRVYFTPGGDNSPVWVAEDPDTVRRMQKDALT
jgi:hypothetical protein